MSVESVIANAASQIAGAISRAARSTGISFDYLLTTAQMESGLDPQAQAPTSSAKGLYQFIDQTWLATLKKDGAAFGLGQYANAIQQGPDGHYSVPDPTARAAILKLRSDPSASALMAGAFTRANAIGLQNAIGRKPTEAELYMAHFLGPAGATKLIQTADVAPQTNAAKLFPQAAVANRSIFYDRSGQARSVAGVYENLTGRYETARKVVFNSGLGETVARAATTAASLASVASKASPAPDTAGVTQVLAEAGDQRPLSDSAPFFRTMFSDIPRHGVSATVNTLWAKNKEERQAAAQPSLLLDLFRTGRADVRKLFGEDA